MRWGAQLHCQHSAHECLGTTINFSVDFTIKRFWRVENRIIEQFTLHTKSTRIFTSERAFQISPQVQRRMKCKNIPQVYNANAHATTLECKNHTNTNTRQCLLTRISNLSWPWRVKDKSPPPKLQSQMYVNKFRFWRIETQALPNPNFKCNGMLFEMQQMNWREILSTHQWWLCVEPCHGVHRWCCA